MFCRSFFFCSWSFFSARLYFRSALHRCLSNLPWWTAGRPPSLNTKSVFCATSRTKRVFAVTPQSYIRLSHTWCRIKEGKEFSSRQTRGSGGYLQIFHCVFQSLDSVPRVSSFDSACIANTHLIIHAVISVGAQQTQESQVSVKHKWVIERTCRLKVSEGQSLIKHLTYFSNILVLFCIIIDLLLHYYRFITFILICNFFLNSVFEAWFCCCFLNTFLKCLNF